MTGEQLNNVNVVSQELLPTPESIKQQLPITDKATSTVMTGRKTVQRILDSEDPRLFIVVGPCSIHDLDAAREYAGRLKRLADKVSDTLVLIMRVYFEKPRTTVGWKGLINDPDMDDSFHIEKGLYLARQFLLEVADLAYRLKNGKAMPVEEVRSKSGVDSEAVQIDSDLELQGAANPAKSE